MCKQPLFYTGVLLSIFFHMLSLCNILLWVNKKGACITYDSKLPIIPYPRILWRCLVPFCLPYITLKSIYNAHKLLLQHITYPRPPSDTSSCLLCSLCLVMLLYFFKIFISSCYNYYVDISFRLSWSLLIWN